MKQKFQLSCYYTHVPNSTLKTARARPRGPCATPAPPLLKRRNPRLIRTGREHSGSPGPSSLLRQGHPIAHGTGQNPALEYLQRGRLHTFPTEQSLPADTDGHWWGKREALLGRAPAGPRLHWAMISSKAWRCSRSRRRSSSAMCRFQGGKPEVRSPDAMSAAGRGGGGRGGRHGGQGGGESAGRRRKTPQSRARARGRAPAPAPAMAPRYVRGPRLCEARCDRDRGCPAAAWRRPPASDAADAAAPVSPGRKEPHEVALQTRRRGRLQAEEQASSEVREFRAAPFCVLHADAILRVALSPSWEWPRRHLGRAWGDILRGAKPPCWGPGRPGAAHADRPPDGRGHGCGTAGWALTQRVGSLSRRSPRSQPSQFNARARPAALRHSSDTAGDLMRWRGRCPRSPGTVWPRPATATPLRATVKARVLLWVNINHVLRASQRAEGVLYYTEQIRRTRSAICCSALFSPLPARPLRACRESRNSGIAHAGRPHTGSSGPTPVLHRAGPEPRA